MLKTTKAASDWDTVSVIGTMSALTLGMYLYPPQFLQIPDALSLPS